MMKKILTKDVKVSEEAREKLDRIREKIKGQEKRLPNVPFKIGK